MMPSRKSVIALGCILVACSALWHYFYRGPSLKSRIEAAALSAPNGDPARASERYQKELIALAKEPTGELLEAFKSLDFERSGEGHHNPPNDRVWLTGTLVTILAFDCPPIGSRDLETLDWLKSRWCQHLSELKQDEATNRMIATYPWRNVNGSWQLGPVWDFNPSGTSDGWIASRLEYYASQFKRRRL